MASVTTDKNGNRRIVFKAPDGKRQAIYLGQVTKKAADQVRYHIEEIVSARLTNTPLNATTSQWVNTLSDLMCEKLANVGLVEQQERVKLSEFMDCYIKSRSSLKPNTVRNLKGSSSLLKEFYGTEKELHTISKSDADAFREFLVSKKYSPATIGRVIKRARQFFTAAIRKNLIGSNPFADVNAPQQVNDTRREYVPAKTVYKAINAAPNAEWRLIIALSRFCGLRIPSELVTLKWEDIDWANHKIRVHQPKLEHHPGGAFRVVPLFPRLRPYLEEQFELAEPGAEYVITSDKTANSNLRTQFLRILKRAMIKPWPRLFHNMRASFQTDICEQFPAHVSAEWCGNSLEVAEKHYLSTTEDHFRRAVEEQTDPRKDDAHSDARYVRNGRK